MLLIPSQAVCSFSLAQKPTRSYADFVGFVTALQERIRSRSPSVRVLTLQSRDRYHFAAAAFASLVLGVELKVAATKEGDEISRLSGSSPETSVSALDPLDLSQFDDIKRRAVLPLELDLRAERPWLHLTTSGSDGGPTSWAKSARQLFLEAKLHRQWLGLGPGDRLGLTVRPEHIYGLLFGVLLPIVSGASFCRETPQHAASILAMTEKERITHLVTVPAHLRAVLNDLEAHPSLVVGSATTTMISSGARLHPDLAGAFDARGIRVLDVLGSTETGGIAWREPSRTEVYQPFPGIHVETSPEGRLILSSPFLPNEMVPFASEDRIEPEGGGFRYLGRRDRIVKVAGTRVSLEEVAASVREIPGVLDALSFAKEEEPSVQVRGHVIYLVVVTQVLDRGTVWRELRARLAGASVPRHLRIVDRLPVDERGKIAQKQLETLFAETPPNVEALNSAGEVSLFPVATPICEGHFEGEPIVPGAVAIADLVLAKAGDVWPDLGTPTDLLRLRFMAPIPQGHEARVELRRRSSRVDFEILVDASRVATGTIEYESSHGPKTTNPV